jgi:divalent metal cation (Fe/Co/Zn/Cd) transporter
VIAIRPAGITIFISSFFLALETGTTHTHTTTPKNTKPKIIFMGVSVLCEVMNALSQRRKTHVGQKI